MKLTNLGKFLRKFRIDNSLILKNMADDLGVSSAYLSAIEYGIKPIPSNLEEKLIKKYNFKDELLSELRTAIDTSKEVVNIKTNNDFLNQQILGAFGRNLSSLNEEQKRKILEIMENK